MPPATSAVPCGRGRGAGVVSRRGIGQIEVRGAVVRVVGRLAAAFGLSAARYVAQGARPGDQAAGGVEGCARADVRAQVVPPRHAVDDRKSGDGRMKQTLPPAGGITGMIVRSGVTPKNVAACGGRDQDRGLVRGAGDVRGEGEGVDHRAGRVVHDDLLARRPCSATRRASAAPRTAPSGLPVRAGEDLADLHEVMVGRGGGHPQCEQPRQREEGAEQERARRSGTALGRTRSA